MQTRTGIRRVGAIMGAWLTGAGDTPQPIADRISNALEVALATPDAQQKLDLAGCKAKSAPLKQFAGIVKAAVALWAKVVKDAGIPAD